MGFWSNKEKGYGSYKQGKKAAKEYISSGNMGVDTGAFSLPSEQQQRFDTMAAQAAERTAPSASQVSLAPTARIGGLSAEQEQFRAFQQSLYNALLSKAARDTTGPSAAEAQLRSGFNKASAEARALARTATGRDRTAALKGAMNVGAAMAGEASTQAAALRASEEDARRARQLQALSTAGGLLQTGRQQDIGMAGLESGQNIAQAQLEQQTNLQQAQLQQQTNLANLQAQISQGASNDQLMIQLINQGLTRDQAQAQLNLAQQQLQAQNYATAMGSQRQETPGIGQQLVSSAIQGAAKGGGEALMGAALSDKRLKKDIKNADKQMAEFLSNLEPQKWSYKKKASKYKEEGISVPDGVNYGVMAQDLQKSELGKKLVGECPDGALNIRTYEATGPILASLAYLYKEMKKKRTNNG